MKKNEIIEKIKFAEEVSVTSTKFPELAFQLVLAHLLAGSSITTIESEQREIHKVQSSKRADKPKAGKTGKGLSQKINDLISQGFFDEAKIAKQVIEKLKLIGYKMPATSLPSYLIPKVRNGELERTEIKTENGKIYGYLRKNK